MSRTIELTLSEEFLTLASLGTLIEKDRAVGYLCNWAIHSERYCRLTIYGDKEGNLNASYRNAAGEVTYSMFGMRGEDGTYSFHS